MNLCNLRNLWFQSPMVHRRSQIVHSRNSKFEMFSDRPSSMVSRQRSPTRNASCFRTYVPHYLRQQRPPSLLAIKFAMFFWLPSAFCSSPAPVLPSAAVPPCTPAPRLKRRLPLHASLFTFHVLRFTIRSFAPLSLRMSKSTWETTSPITTLHYKSARLQWMVKSGTLVVGGE